MPIFTKKASKSTKASGKQLGTKLKRKDWSKRTAAVADSTVQVPAKEDAWPKVIKVIHNGGKASPSLGITVKMDDTVGGIQADLAEKIKSIKKAAVEPKTSTDELLPEVVSTILVRNAVPQVITNSSPDAEAKEVGFLDNGKSYLIVVLKNGCSFEEMIQEELAKGLVEDPKDAIKAMFNGIYLPNTASAHDAAESSSSANSNQVAEVGADNSSQQPEQTRERRSEPGSYEFIMICNYQGEPSFRTLQLTDGDTHESIRIKLGQAFTLANTEINGIDIGKASHVSAAYFTSNDKCYSLEAVLESPENSIGSCFENHFAIVVTVDDKCKSFAGDDVHSQQYKVVSTVPKEYNNHALDSIVAKINKEPSFLSA
ncbi:hypothetical protein GGF46_005027 [Coemansia sp. RSA 552]|nr:hypothetical protein GGF46_005027 [Coemansia sp. RSA 552]